MIWLLAILAAAAFVAFGAGLYALIARALTELDRGDRIL